MTAKQAELIVGRIVDVLDHPGARAPSFLLRVDLGTRGERQAQMEPGSYNRKELLDKLVVLSLADEAIVVAARSHTHGPVLIVPAEPVEPGTTVA